jgi:hypothetical protein
MPAFKTIAALIMHVAAAGAPAQVNPAPDLQRPATTRPATTPAAQPLAGTIQTPDGKPELGAYVIAAGPYTAALHGPPRGAHGIDFFITAADGKFALKPRAQPFGLLVRSPEGYAIVKADSLKPDQPITLSPWSRIEVTAKQGSRPINQARITFYAKPIPDLPIQASEMVMLADDRGRLTISQVLPGAARLTCAGEPDSKLPPREIRINVEPGKTHQVAFGGVGRPVTGKVEADIANLAHRRGVIRPNTPKDKAATQSVPQHSPIYFDVNLDGSFEVFDVPPGEYQLNIDFGTADERATFVETHATAKATFKMPEVPGGQSDEPLDLGKLEATFKNLIHVGDAFPKLAGQTPKGDPLSLADFHGQYVLLHIGAPNFVRKRTDDDWAHAVYSRFAHDPAFAALTVITKDGFIGQPPPWPTLIVDADKLPEELDPTTPRSFLIDPNGHLLGKNMSAHQAYSILDKSLEHKPDPRVTFEYVPRAQARTNPPYDKIPAPSADDVAAGAPVALVAGVPSWDTPERSSKPTHLTDGTFPANEDDPASCFFLQSGSMEGRVRIDLSEPTPIAEIRSYSWHKDTRAAQVYRIYGSDGTGENFNPAPRFGTDPAKHGWTKIATVDTRPDLKPIGGQNAAVGGRYAASIADKDNKTLGTYRHLLVQIFMTESDDIFGHTFYSEIDVIRAN